VGFLRRDGNKCCEIHVDVKELWYSHGNVPVFCFYGAPAATSESDSYFFQTQKLGDMLKLRWQCKITAPARNRMETEKNFAGTELHGWAGMM